MRIGRSVVIAVLMVPAWITTANAQQWELLAPEYIGLRVSGPLLAGVPVIVLGQQLHFTLDALQAQPVDLRVEVVHCDRNWEPTPSEFVNDPFLKSGRKPIPSTSAGSSIRSYRWTYGASLPGGAGLEPFRFSGNYRAAIIEQQGDRIVAAFRFSVAEVSSPAAITVRQRRLPMKISPWDEAHQVSVAVSEAVLGGVSDNAHLQLVRVVDVYKNREWDAPHRIDMDALTPATWIEGLGTSAVTFTAGEVMPGNEYRSVDIRNVDQYPASQVLRSRDGTDVSRFFGSRSKDNNGASVLVSAREYADYERFEFQLWWESDRSDEPLYVLGDFNGWSKRTEWRLEERGEDGRYAATGLLKRGRYDYQYVVGDDPGVLEGNSWSTSNVYTALVYYSDSRQGGYDRILFVAQTESSGLTRARKEKSR